MSFDWLRTNGGGRRGRGCYTEGHTSVDGLRTNGGGAGQKSGGLGWRGGCCWVVPPTGIEPVFVA